LLNKLMVLSVFSLLDCSFLLNIPLQQNPAQVVEEPVVHKKVQDNSNRSMLKQRRSMKNL